MTKFQYFICVVTTTCVTALISSGCEVQRYTTKFQATPMESVNEDLSIDPQKLTGELDEQMRIDDEKRRNLLLDKAKADAEKGSKSATQKTEAVK